jgi:quinol monooxygenase YgiN
MLETVNTADERGMSTPQASTEIVLVATFHACPDTVDELTRRLVEMVALTLTEPGCLRYDLHVDVDDPCRLVFLETWADAAALVAHDMTQHVQAIRTDAPQLTTEPISVHRLRPLVARE